MILNDINQQPFATKTIGNYLDSQLMDKNLICYGNDFLISDINEKNTLCIKIDAEMLLNLIDKDRYERLVDSEGFYLNTLVETINEQFNSIN